MPAAAKKKRTRPPAIVEPKLTDKQALFCTEYLVDMNATQAAIRAGYSKKSAKEQGRDNMTKPHIKRIITEKKVERSMAVELDAEYVLRESKYCYELCKTNEDMRGAKGFLELVGRHTRIQAFQPDAPPPPNQVFVLNMTGIRDGEPNPYLDYIEGELAPEGS